MRTPTARVIGTRGRALVGTSAIALGVALASCAPPTPNSVRATFPASTAIDQTAAVTVSFTNDAGFGALSLISFRVLPSCGGTVEGLTSDPAAVLGCTNPDAGVFQLVPDPVTPPSAGCNSAGLATSAPDAAGIVTFTPTGSPVTVNPGDTCTITLRQTTLGLPAVDVDPSAPGVQTFTGAGAALDVNGSPLEFTTLGTPAQVTVTQAQAEAVPNPPPTCPTNAPNNGDRNAAGTFGNNGNDNLGSCNNGNRNVGNNSNGNDNGAPITP
ncbi:MAG: hypothetical protein ACT4QF_09760 [Sporichthyaceae bacterium]